MHLTPNSLELSATRQWILDGPSIIKLHFDRHRREEAYGNGGLWIEAMQKELSLGMEFYQIFLWNESLESPIFFLYAEVRNQNEL